ncbi:Hint domain-containing protein [Pseudoalteromonas luteoviolacea]|uniref:Hint domain-containing protein n=1 Tax=Pseudoalteromonas luteoviolacea H33 TaxID=1365251 RepID=A0A167DXA5_9GAMM|nr:Hint domain-containing protein [Pseudoalteromonas luteoviolacea]KZN49713.1 hypothetical protein N476_18145 [Pseudoalteromonas luteoviolacea H33]KZN77737.1 hypothetical protein N477_00600 [Pseudoalteromonas luteoviolacea H33-S]MBQ4878775.1 hypothetical protein [Pseudoalteromonas luteoviolacea]MBQ4907817.1 hypothetical protein [Pseudoalteromonas luteoviolacea]
MKVFTLLVSLFASFLAFQASATMDVATYSNRAEVDAGIAGRCVYQPIGTSACHMRIDWAVQNGKITQRAGDWGKANGFYPVIDMFSHAIAAVCKCGCFEQDTLIRVLKDGKIQDIRAKDLGTEDSLVALNDDATLSNMSTEVFEMKARTKGPETPALYVFTFEDGNELKVTQHHGMLIGDGTMVAAKDVKVGHSMYNAEGVELKVASIEREYTKFDVYNFETQGDVTTNHIIVANGMFVGDLTWQNQFAADLGKVIVRQ